MGIDAHEAELMCKKFRCDREIRTRRQKDSLARFLRFLFSHISRHQMRHLVAARKHLRYFFFSAINTRLLKGQTYQT